MESMRSHHTTKLGAQKETLYAVKFELYVNKIMQRTREV